MNNNIRDIIIIVSILGGLLGVFMVVFIVLFTKKKNSLILKNQLLQSQHQQALLQTQLEIQEQTLKNISQEIHDNIGQVLSLAKLNLATLKPGEDTRLSDTKDLVSKAISDLRNLSRSMLGEKVAEAGLVQSIEHELQVLRNTGQFQTQLEVKGKVVKLDQRKEMILFRIVQEALNNAVKHGKATNLKVKLIYEPEHLILQVYDDGKGFEPEKLDAGNSGIGFTNMKSRVKMIQAKLDIFSQPGKGTQITVETPIAIDL